MQDAYCYDEQMFKKDVAMRNTRPYWVAGNMISKNFS